MTFLGRIPCLMKHNFVKVIINGPLQHRRCSVLTRSAHNVFKEFTFSRSNRLRFQPFCSSALSVEESFVDKQAQHDVRVKGRVELVIQEMLDAGIINEKRSQSSLFQSFVETLVRSRVQKKLVKKHFSYYPEFYKVVTASEWQTVNDTLRDYGFESQDIAVRLPWKIAVFKLSEKDLRVTLDRLKSLKFSTRQLVTICVVNPSILLLPLAHILASYEELHQWFSKKDVAFIVTNNPRVLTRQRSHVAEIIDYVQQEMGLDVKDTVRSHAFSKPLLRIKTRHQFLQRAGLWKTNAVTNEMLPSFFNVVDTDDRYFCKKIAGVSSKEYKVFCKLMEMEEDEQHLDSEDEMEDD